MELQQLLSIFDAASANLAKAERVWSRARPLLPDSAVLGGAPGFDDFARDWLKIIAALPPVDDWTITDPLPTPNQIGQAFLDCMDIDMPAWSVYEAIEKPDKDLEQYGYLLRRARREAVRHRIEELVAEVDRLLPLIVDGVPTDADDPLEHPGTALIRDHIAEVERLLADTCPRAGRWPHMRRHMSFGQCRDWWDITQLDWPSIKPEILAATAAPSDPLPVPDIDLGVAARSAPSGGVTSALQWDAINDDEFERLLFDLIRGLPGYDNVAWLMKTKATDNGRDLSAHRTLPDPSGHVRHERVVIQAKHWLKNSVDSASILDVLSRLSAWEPPHIHCLVVATSGRFTPAAVRFADTHNDKGVDPRVELWPETQLEAMLARRPDLTAAYRLRRS